MSAQASSFTAPMPAHVFVTDRETRKIKANHQQLAHVINRMTARMGFPDKAARGVVGIHGLLNGREKFPALVSHRLAARQFNFAGKEENSDVFMGRYLDALKAAEMSAGRKCFEIERADGVTTIITTYHADYIGEAALWALAEARASEEWKKCPAKAVSDELVDRAIARLPECAPPDKGDKSDGHSFTDDAIIKGMWTKVDTLAESAMRKVALAGGDPLAELEEVHRRQRRIAAEVRREQLERDRAAKDAEYFATLDWLDLDGVVQAGNGKNISDKLEKFSTAAEQPAEDPTIRQSVGTPESEPVEIQDFADSNFDESENLRLAAALSAAAGGVPVFPLHEVYDDICTCTCTRKKCGKGKHGCGSECTNKGKHPRTPHGKDDATTDPAQIKVWWTKWPTANIGARMVGRLAVDVDPKNGGSASLHDLTEAHGPEWLDTRTHETGSLGLHFIYTLPEGLNLPNTAGKIAPGIDTRSADGYIVWPPSLHASGRRYSVKEAKEERPAPDWIIEAITRPDDQQPAKVIDFQERRAASTGGVRFFHEGERNDGLRDVACGRWVNGWATDVQDLYQQLIEVRDTRCAPGQTPPPSDAELFDLAQRTARKYARGEMRQHGGAA